MFRNPRLFAITLIATGLGVCAWYGQEWVQLPEWSEAEIEQSVELNLQLDLARMGPQLAPTGEKLEKLRELVRGEVEGSIRREREQVERWLGFGLLVTVLGVGQFVLSLAFTPRK